MPFPRWILPARPLVLAAALLLPPAAALSQSPQSQLVRVGLGPALPLDSLLAGGFDIATVAPGASVDLVVQRRDEERLRARGIPFQVLDDSLEAHYAARAAAELRAHPQPTPARVRSAVRPDGIFRVEALPPFGSGSMGGFWTLDEVKMKLDSLVASDTRDLVADKLDTLGTTWEGRPIWGLRIGKRVEGTDSRPVAFFNALTHAREPEGMQALFWFVDDLLSRYDTDAFAKYLLDQRVIYICPVVNPDGYRYNQSTNPSGGGMWRKNRHGPGVDLNRNYGFKWGCDNTGSSPNPSDETYRGAAAFSESETCAQRDIIAALQPKTGITFHAYSDDFLHAWSYVPLSTPDAAAFYEWDDEATRGSSYIAGEAARTLYMMNGDFNDWAYGDTTAKPRCFTWLPEIGTSIDDFWPRPSRIVPLAQENLRKCYTVAAIAGPYVRVESTSLAEGTLDAGNLAHLALRARNLGLGATPANLTATLVPLDAGIGVLPSGSTAPYPALASRTSADATDGATFLISAADSVTPGRLVRFAADFAADGGYFSRDTVEVIVGRPTVLLTEPCNVLSNWTASAGGWGVVSGDPRHPDHYFADSYFYNSILPLVYGGQFSLAAGVHAWVLFDARWVFRPDCDGTVVEASFDSVTWAPLAGRTTTLGVMAPQPVGSPLYQGSRILWRAERIDLSSFAGPDRSPVYLRFRTVAGGATDFGRPGAGFNFDSLRVLLYDPAVQLAPAAVGPAVTATLELANPWPNPAHDLARLRFDLPHDGPLRLELFDLQGRRVRTMANGRYSAGRYALAWDLRDDAGRVTPSGLYVVRLSGAAGQRVRRLAVIR